MKKLYLILFALIITHTSKAQWAVLHSGSETFRSVNFPSSNVGYVCGKNHPSPLVGACNPYKILKTTNQGQSWQYLSLPYNYYPTSVFFQSNDTGFFTDSVSLNIYKTTDGGATWSSCNTGGASRKNSLFFISSDTGYAVGNSGTIVKTIDGGLNWLTQVSGTNKHLKSVYFSDANTGYALGEKIVLKTNNGGINWDSLNIDTTHTFKSVFFTDLNTGFVVGDVILKTTNGGILWTSTTLDTTVIFNSVHFANDSVGYVVGSSGKVFKTLNEGLNWQLINSGTGAGLNSVYCINQDQVYTAGTSIILGTTTGGVYNCNNSEFVVTGLHPNKQYYHDITPDTTIIAHSIGTYGAYNSIHLDINNDGINDFKFEARRSGGLGPPYGGTSITPLNGNQISINSELAFSPRILADALLNNDTINCLKSWSDKSANLAYFFAQQCGPYCQANIFLSDTVRRYIGVRLFINTDTIYGWIKLKDVTYNQFTLMEYACNQEYTGINETNSLSLLKIYPCPAKNELTIETPKNQREGVLIIYNLYGSELLKQQITSSKTNLDIGNWANGYYLIKLISKNKTYLGKLIKE